MKRAVFEIKQNPVGRYYFIFRGIEGTVLVVSQSFSDRSQLEKCISNVRSVAQVGEIKENESDKMQFPFFKIEKENEYYVFFLIGFQGEVIFSSDSYQEKEECVKAIKLFKSLSFHAGILDSV